MVGISWLDYPDEKRPVGYRKKDQLLAASRRHEDEIWNHYNPGESANRGVDWALLEHGIRHEIFRTYNGRRDPIDALARIDMILAACTMRGTEIK